RRAASGTAASRPCRSRSCRRRCDAFPHVLTTVRPRFTLARMARPAPIDVDEETIPVPGTVRFPVELTPPEGFDPARLETWPRVAGRLEWVRGRLLYMPPCRDRQQYTVADVVATLIIWVRPHPGFA